MNCSSTHLTSDPTGVMLLTWQQPDSTATALNKFCSICTPNGVYTEFGIDPKCSTHLVTATFKDAFRVRGNPTGLTFHSDRGGQYISDTFYKLLQQGGVKQSFSRSGRPCDNAVAETFFASFKREEAYRRDYSSEADFRKSVDEYVRFYNEQRPHQTLAYKSPVRFEELYGQCIYRTESPVCTEY